MWTLLLIFLSLSAAAAEETPKWNVEEPFGPTSPLEFETDEGTWINLDVSPDGKRIVFDILGDLCLMPMVVLNANPLDDIRNSEQVSQVMVNGRLYEAATMTEVGRASKTRRPFYWQLATGNWQLP
ncbi:MAG: hypothetical protein ACRD3V_02665 [Vicinamibacteria bacterium]